VFHFQLATEKLTAPLAHHGARYSRMDGRDGAKARMMNTVNMSSSVMTRDMCVHFCTSTTATGQRFKYAGVEDGNQ
jgi:hypothetical protein